MRPRRDAEVEAANSRAPASFTGRARRAAGAVLLVAAAAGGRTAWTQDPPTPRSSAPPQSESPGRPAEFAERLDVKVVNVEVWVNRKDGSPVEGLVASDFKLLVDGAEVPITNFYSQVDGAPATTDRRTGVAAPADRAVVAGESVAPPPPGKRRTVILVDNANLRAANRRRVFEHLRTFLRQSLRPGDPVSVVSLGDSLVIHCDFLDDLEAIERILGDLEKVSQRSAANDLQRRQLLSDLFEGTAMRGTENRTSSSDQFNSGPQLDLIRAYAAEEYQQSKASLGALDRFLASLGGIAGRKSAIYVSEGIPNHPGEELFIAWRERYRDLRHQRITTLDAEYYREVGQFELLQDFQALARRANASGVTLYAIDAVSDHTADLRSADLSGGVVQEALYTMEANVRDPLESTAVATGGLRLQASPSLAADLARLATDFATSYSLGFQPRHGVDGKDHTIEVKLRRGDGTVRHREHYRLKSNDESMAEATMASLLYQAGENPLGLRLAAGQPQARADGLSVLPVKVEVSMRDVAMVPRGDVYASQFVFYITVKDRAGQPQPVQRVPFHITVPAAGLDAARGQAAAYELPVVLRPGDQQVAIGVLDEIGGASATARLEVQASQNGRR